MHDIRHSPLRTADGREGGEGHETERNGGRREGIEFC